MKRPSIVRLELPLIEEKGYLSRTLRNRIPHIPRIGESLYIAPELFVKVVSVEYMAIDYNLINIRLEPISSSFIHELTEERRARKWKGEWTYYASHSRSL